MSMNDDVEVEAEAVETVYDGFFKIDVHRLRYRRFDGTMSRHVSRELLERGTSVCVLPYDPIADKVLLVRLFLVGAFAAGLPARPLQVIAGMVDEDETEEDAVRREAMEEAGCTLRRIVRAQAFLPSPGGTSERVTAFCGEADLRDAGGLFGNASEDEDIRAEIFDADAAIALLDSGAIEAGPAVVALSWFARHRGKIRKEWTGGQSQPNGPATEVVKAMDAAIEEDDAKKKR